MRRRLSNTPWLSADTPIEKNSSYSNLSQHLPCHLEFKCGWMDGRCAQLRLRTFKKDEIVLFKYHRSCLLDNNDNSKITGVIDFLLLEEVG